MATLQITDLHVQIATENGPKEILKGLSLTIETGETHAIMGPNGSGKSTLASTIAGHPRYEVTSGSITLDGEDVLEIQSNINGTGITDASQLASRIKADANGAVINLGNDQIKLVGVSAKDLIGNLDEAVLVISLFASKGLELTAAVLLSSADYSRPLRRLASSPTFGGD